MYEREKRENGKKRDAKSIDVCLHHVADRKGGEKGETGGLFILRCVCMCVGPVILLEI